MAKIPFTVARISDETTNGNVIITIKHQQEIDTPFGKKDIKTTACFAVKAGTCKVNVDEVVELDPKSYTLEKREWVDEEGNSTYTNWLKFGE